MGKGRYFVCLPAALLLTATGCYQYQPPRSALEGTVFNQVNREESDRILAEVDVLTLPIAERIAEVNNQNYIAAAHAVDAARMRYYQSLSAFVPEITASSAVGQDLTWLNNRVNPLSTMPGRDYKFTSMTTVGASWLLFDGLARELNVAMQEHDVKRQEAMRAKILMQLRRAVAYALEDLQLATQVAAIQQQNKEFQLMMHQLVEPEFRQGKRPEDEVLNFKILAVDAETRRVEAIYQGDVSNYALSQLLGYPEGVLPGSARIAPPDERIRPLPFDVDTAINFALRNSPAMKVMEETLKISEYAKYKSYSSYLPTFHAYADFNYQVRASRYQDFMYTHNYADGPGFQYGIRGDYTIFNGLARYNKMREMQAAYAESQYNMAEEYLQTVNNARAAYANYVNQATQTTLYYSIMEDALRQRDLVLDRYRNYHVSVDRMDKVQQYYVDTRIAYATGINQLNKALAQLRMVLCVPIFND